MAGQFPSMGGGGISQANTFMMQQQQNVAVSGGTFTSQPTSVSYSSPGGEPAGTGYPSFSGSPMAPYPGQTGAPGSAYPAPPAYSQSGGVGGVAYSAASPAYSLSAAPYGAQSPVHAQSPARPMLSASPAAASFPAGPAAYQHMAPTARFQQPAFQQQQQQAGFGGQIQGFSASGPQQPQQQQQPQFGQIQQQQQQQQMQAQFGMQQAQQQQQPPGSFPQQSAMLMSNGVGAGMAQQQQLAGAQQMAQQQPQPPQQPQQQQQQVVSTAQPQQQRDYNVATLCRYGQEYLLDLVSRAQELFNLLKMHQPPNGTEQGRNLSADKREKVKQQLDCIRLLFRRLRIFHDRINDSCAGLEFTPMERLIPYKDEPETKQDESKTVELLRQPMEEYSELKEQVQQRNRYLKEVIDQLRNIVWDVNTMLAMRCSS